LCGAEGAFFGTTTRLEREITGIRFGEKRGIDSQHSIACSRTLKAMYRGASMKTVILDVRSHKQVMAEALAAVKAGRPAKNARISFATPELLWRVLTAKRWEILKTLCGAGPVSIREVARRVGRDVKAVHSDITALLSAGVIDRTESGQVEFPYEAVKVEFLLEAA